MAARAQPVILWAGISALVLTSALILAPPLVLFARVGNAVALGGNEAGVIWFTLGQAFLSASISVLLAIPLARALDRRRFIGRSVLITFLGAPFLLPVIVAILGLVAVWGRSGWVSDLIAPLGFGPIDIYGLPGILLAHVFFNLPLVTRLILQGWAQIPAEHFRLAAQSGFRPAHMFRHLEWPMLRTILPGAFLLVFLLCVTSFAVALTLGGGPAATTIEVAIYEAIRLDFDLSKAAMLAIVQFAICAVLAIVSVKLKFSAGFGQIGTDPVKRWDSHSQGLKTQDSAIIVGVTMFLITPLAAITLRGIAGFSTMPDLWSACIYSLTVALSSALVALILALFLAQLIDLLHAQRSRFSGLAEIVGLITLAASPFVLGTGIFIILYPLTNPFALAIPVTALVNAMISVPIVLRVLLPSLRQNRESFSRVADSLSLTGWYRFKLMVWPSIRAPMGFAAGLSAALSMGDLGVITLFAPPDVETLPLLMYRLMGAYRMDAAASVALVLVALTLALFWMFDRGGRYGHKSG